MKRKLFLSLYCFIIATLIILSAFGKFLHSPGRLTISLGSVLFLLFLFLSFSLLRYDFHLNVFLWLPLFVLLSNLSIQLTGGVTQSMFSPLYLFLIIIVALKSEKPMILFTLFLIFVLEFFSTFLNQRISLHFLIIMIILVPFSFFLSYFIKNLKRKKKEIEKKLNDIEKASSVLSISASTNDADELFKTLKDDEGGSYLKANEKMIEVIDPLFKVLSDTTTSLSSVIFLKEKNKKSFFLVFHKSHSAYINENAVISRETGIYSWVIKEKKPFINNHFLLDSTNLGYYSKDENIRSIIVIPLLEENELIGILVCDSREENKFDWNDKERLKDFGNLLLITLSLFKSLYIAQRDKIKHAALHNMGKKLSQSLEPDKVLDILTDIAPRSFEFDLLVLIRCTKKVKPVIYKTSPDDKFAYLKGLEISPGGSLAGLVIQNNQELIKPKKIKTPFFSKRERGLEHFQSFFGVPMHKDEKVSGELVLLSKTPSQFSLDKKEPVMFLANLISVALEKAKLYQETKELSIRDGLTGAFNHKYFQEHLASELQRAQRIGIDFSLLMFDIDHFKSFNDNFGHQMGDKVLKHISEIVKKNIRDIDIFARYGGEEFIIILPDTGREGAMALGEKIRMLIEKKPLIIDENIYSVTISIGCAVFPFDGENKNTLIKNADVALYRAKQDGRNRVRAVT